MPDRDPKGFAVGSDGLAVIATLQEIVMARDGNRVSAFKPSYEPTAVSYHPTQPEVVIGGKDNVVRVYSVSGDSLTEKTTIETTDEISAVAYSPTGEFLAVTSGRSVCTYETASFQLKHNMLFHTARATCIAWSPDSSKIVSGGIDTNICVWDAVKGQRITMIKGAHPLSVVTGVVWLSDSSFASSGFDCCIRLWENSS